MDYGSISLGWGSIWCLNRALDICILWWIT